MQKQQLKSVVRTSILLIGASTFGLTGCLMLDVLAAAGGYQPPPANTAYVPSATVAYPVYPTYVPSNQTVISPGQTDTSTITKPCQTAARCVSGH
jgi:hypothetical protein